MQDPVTMTVHAQNCEGRTVPRQSYPRLRAAHKSIMSSLPADNKGSR